MEHNAPAKWYDAFKAKDARFDGRFFVGILSTGIYCRPVCRARLPRRENCTFFFTAAEAEHAGYRPCLRCRPELAPGASATDAVTTLAQNAARLLEENLSGGQSLAALARQLGCSDRHLRRAFHLEYNVSPVEYLQTCRLLLAKSLLTDTGLSILDVAMASGFGSLRRFNDLFKKQYRLCPTALRKQIARGDPQSGSIELPLAYRPPYMWPQMLDFLAHRTIPGVEIVRDGRYLRTVQLISAEGNPVRGVVKISHRPGQNALAVALDAALLPVLPQVLARVRHLFDLQCDPHAVYDVLAQMNELRPGLSTLGTRLPGCFDSFEMAVRAVLGQQITLKAAGTLAGRLVSAYGTPIETGIDHLTHTFPTPQDILAPGDPIEERLGPLGITAIRSKAIAEIARGIVEKRFDLNHCARPEAEIRALQSIPGIGGWTAQYIAMRAMQWPDTFLDTDVGVKKALVPHSSGQLRQLAEAWRPWRSYATVNLWNSRS